MNKKIFFPLIAIMTFALLGIIFVQGFWIKTTLDNKERQFSLNINQALKSVSEQIQSREMRDYLAVYQKLIDSIGSPKESQLSAVFKFVDRNENTNQTYIYSHGILEEDYNVSSKLFDQESLDTSSIIEYKGIKTTTIIDEAFDREMQNMSSIERLQRVERLSLMDKAKYASVFMELASLKPIHRRLTNIELELLLQRELRDRDIDIPFQYRVFNGTFATKVGSDNYTNLEGLKKYKSPLFVNENGDSEFELVIAFPERKIFLRSSLTTLILLSLLFTLAIIITFASTIFQILKQKKVSEIKSDFINNMTHEFKTPIATIKLAIDAIENVNVKNDLKKRSQYLRMIKDENERMNYQVENVLRISQLEKKENIIKKIDCNAHDIIEESFVHLKLLFKNRNASVVDELYADQFDIMGSHEDLVNVVVNILENSIKYSKDIPRIKVSTYNESNHICIKISDKGMGMNKDVKERIFDKFYRQTKGNIHNVKGHGLGLSYVKKIIDLHFGTINVDSIEGEGSTFVIKLPVKI
ncbi:HAMP domain-containing histidine kinase [Flavobacteriaceae bacterium]|nr:HAMP domain-containing histidine kinase [Flavobacteriaceae bacterium]MDA7716348.1 HAMP domain-containing histidine kinase [Flavobacteriaceae bacterium]